MSIHATVNTNVSSELNTQKLINSYDGGAQPVVIGLAASNLTQGTTHMTVALTTAETNLLNVSTLTLTYLVGILSSNQNTGGITFTLTFTGASGAASSAARDAWEKATSTQYNVYSLNNEYTSNQVGPGITQVALGGASVQSQTSGNDGVITITVPKTMQGAGVFSMTSFTIHKESLGIASPAPPASWNP
jgi:hypothetical protein